MPVEDGVVNLVAADTRFTFVSKGTCGQCGSTAQNEAKYCPECGTALMGAEPAIKWLDSNDRDSAASHESPNNPNPIYKAGKFVGRLFRTRKRKALAGALLIAILIAAFTLTSAGSSNSTPTSFANRKVCISRLTYYFNIIVNGEEDRDVAHELAQETSGSHDEFMIELIGSTYEQEVDQNVDRSSAAKRHIDEYCKSGTINGKSYEQMLAEQ